MKLSIVKPHFLLTLFVGLCVSSPVATGQDHDSTASRYSRWENGPPEREDYFPIGVWLQNPRNAERFKAVGINLYVGLWKGPTSSQLADLEKAGMRVVCSQNKMGLEQRDNPIIVGWMHGDEPDNAQSLGQGKGYGPPILPEIIVRDYKRIQAADPTRPVFLNLGQGVAWDNYIGRGVRRNHPEDYPEYIQGGDVVSFDIYPVVHRSQEIAGKLEYVARGVERLFGWSGGEQIVWNCIECTHISNPERKATPEQVRSEVWMALIHGSKGLIYFVHQFQPTFREAALLDDKEMVTGISAINRQIQELAPILNQPTIMDGVRVASSTSDKEIEIATMLKSYGSDNFLFTVNLRDHAANVSFTLNNNARDFDAEALGETRRIHAVEGVFEDAFEPYGVHLYRIKNQE